MSNNEINLKLENDKKSKSAIFIDTFADKVNNNTLSEKDIAWGVKCLNSMLEELYNSDELYKLQQAGIDAAAGIIIDGKPINLYPNIKTHSKIYSSLSQNDLGKIKCDIIAKALQGAKIDIIKLKSDEMGNIEPEKAVAVKTEANLPKKSFFQRLLELLGFRSEEKKKIIAANKEPRNLEGYFKEIGPETDEEKKSLDKFKKDIQAAKEKLPENNINENTLQGKKNFGEMDITAPQKPQMFSTAKNLQLTRSLEAQAQINPTKVFSLWRTFSAIFSLPTATARIRALLVSAEC